MVASGKSQEVGGSSKATPDLTPAGITYLALLALQFGMQPLLFKEFMAEGIDKESTVLACEIIKLVLAGAMLITSGGMFKAFENWSLVSMLTTAGAPAVIYAIQNLFIQTAVQNMDGLTFNLLNQSKIIFTAICLYFLMGKKQSFMQCIALCGLFGASAILGKAKASGESADNSFMYGIIPCMIASLLSGLASALSQLILQGKNRNPFLFTMELAFIAILSLLSYEAIKGDGIVAVSRKLQFEGWTMLSLVPVLSNGLGGICVGLVMKYAGGVRKGFSIVMGIILTGVAQYALYSTPLTVEMLVALPLVIVSTSVHMMYPYVDKQKADSKKTK